MAYYSKEGSLVDLDDDETFMSCFMNCLNTTFGKTTSYKYGLIKSILDNLFNAEDLSVKYSDIHETFSRLYWNIVVKYRLPQKRVSQQSKRSTIENIIYSIINENKFLGCCDYDSLAKNVKTEYLNKTKYLIYRKDVVGALYSDLGCKIYGFSNAEKRIYFSDSSFDFLKNNKLVLEKLNYYSWIIWIEKILEKQSDGINNVALKLDLSTKRSSLLEFKKQLFLDSENNRCFYCGNMITLKKCHVDHFIPWNFVKNDKIWNMVLSCSTCNLKKNDKIASKEFLYKIFQRNLVMFKCSFEKQLTQLYDSALYNGFVKWDCEKSDFGGKNNGIND